MKGLSLTQSLSGFFVFVFTSQLFSSRLIQLFSHIYTFKISDLDRSNVVVHFLIFNHFNNLSLRLETYTILLGSLKKNNTDFYKLCWSH